MSIAKLRFFFLTTSENRRKVRSSALRTAKTTATTTFSPIRATIPLALLPRPLLSPSCPPAKANSVALLPSCQGRPLPSPPSLRKAEGRKALSLHVTCNIVTTVATHLSWQDFLQITSFLTSPLFGANLVNI